MQLFSQTYPDLEFMQQAAAQLLWSYLVILIARVKDPKEPLFTYKIAKYGWSRPVMVHLCSVWTLIAWCRSAESNRGPTDYESVALPTELPRLNDN